MATVNSFKVKDGDGLVSSIDLPIQISSNRVIDNYKGTTNLNEIIVKLSTEISQGDQELKGIITNLDSAIAWIRDSKGTVLKESYDTGSRSSERSAVIGEKNTVSKLNSLALGSNNRIDGDNALVLGIGNTAKASNSLVLGSYAKTQDSTLFAIGGGTARQPLNILEVYNQPLTDQLSRSVIKLSGYLLPPTNDVYSIGDADNSFSAMWSERAYAKKGFVKPFGELNYYAPVMQVAYDFPDGSYLSQDKSSYELEQVAMVVDTFSSEVWFAVEYEYVLPTGIDGTGVQNWCCRAFTAPFCPWNFTKTNGTSTLRSITFPIYGPDETTFLTIQRESGTEEDKTSGDFQFIWNGPTNARLELLRLWCIRMPDLRYNRAYGWEDPLE